MLSEITKFFASRIGTLLIDMLLMYVFVSAFELNHMIAKLFVQIVIVITNYVLSKLIVFKETNY